ncbi:rhodanese-like domain-containing protein [Solidesulfovibrio sp.]
MIDQIHPNARRALRPARTVIGPPAASGRGPALLLTVALLLALAACRQPPADDAARQQRVAALYADYQPKFPEAPEIAPAQALERWRAGTLVLIDARSPEEQAVSRLPGAMTETAFLADPARYAGKTAVAYCTIGYRSGLLAQSLAQQGIPVANLAGGLLAWLHAGGTLVDAEGRPTRRVHVYGRTWDLAPLAYEAVW